jgi:hypothetical protein
MGKNFTDKITSDWDQIETARVECAKFLTDSGFSEDVIDAVSLCIGELLENSIKYGDFDDKSGEITYAVNIDSSSITVEVTNPVSDSNIDHLNKLDKTIQWIRGYQNSFEAYIRKLKEISTRSIDDKESGLGLTRIAYESQSILDFYVSEDNQVHVSTVYNY